MCVPFMDISLRASFYSAPPFWKKFERENLHGAWSFQNSVHFVEF